MLRRLPSDRLMKWIGDHPELADVTFYVMLMLLTPFFAIGLMQIASWLRQM